MEIVVAEQTRIFLIAMLLGAGLSFVYDVFRVLRLALPTASPIVVVEDVLYFIICTVATFLYMLATDNGQIRLFVLAGEGIGACICHFTVGELIVGISKAIIEFIKKLFWGIYKGLIRPILALILAIWRFFMKPMEIISNYLKKLFKSLKIRLKKRKAMLYNQYMSNRLKSGLAKSRKAAKRNERKTKKEKPPA